MLCYYSSRQNLSFKGTPPIAISGITYSDVATAAQTLQAKGKNLTVENIRNVLGTGSASTISRLLTEYKTGLRTRQK